ncbi:MAG: hypothetical protein BJ554DRAFT_4572 [Olpidium bornovanus]|uniref:Uncharacterized protein n=1 Tax=Olpidium bornovanus TaxID=278681 RepID=A0A8H8DEK7_9FUNG|nr:MAG: hypothetical protein BJ554DRAFT_4572 [Olpidium bornovanus]
MKLWLPWPPWRTLFERRVVVMGGFVIHLDEAVTARAADRVIIDGR